MNIKRIGTQPSNKGPADWFTGTVRIDPLFQAEPPARVAGATVTFEPGRAHCVAYAPAGTDPHRDSWLRARTALGRPCRGNPPYKKVGMTGLAENAANAYKVILGSIRDSRLTG